MSAAPMKHDFRRGLFALVIALLGAVLLVAWATPGATPQFAGSGYLQAWAGACFKAATGAYGGYWVSRGLLRIDIAEVATHFADGSKEQSLAGSAAQLARALIVAACILAVCLAP